MISPQLFLEWHTVHTRSRVMHLRILDEPLLQLRSHKRHVIVDSLKPRWANSEILDLSHNHNPSMQECLIWSHLISTLNQNSVIVWVLSATTGSDKLPGVYSWEFYWCRDSRVKPWIDTEDPLWLNVVLDLVSASSLGSWLKVWSTQTCSKSSSTCFLTYIHSKACQPLCIKIVLLKLTYIHQPEGFLNLFIFIFIGIR